MIRSLIVVLLSACTAESELTRYWCRTEWSCYGYPGRHSLNHIIYAEDVDQAEDIAVNNAIEASVAVCVADYEYTWTNMWRRCEESP